MLEINTINIEKKTFIIRQKSISYEAFNHLKLTNSMCNLMKKSRKNLEKQ